MTDPWGRGRYGAVLDANNDGYPDIFYGTESLRPDGMPSIDRFYINTGQGSFVDDPAMGLDMNIGSLCAHTVDYNSDGWPDLLVCGETGGLHLFENNQGQGFTDVSSILGAPIKAVDAVDGRRQPRQPPRPHHAHRERARRTPSDLRTGPSASRKSSKTIKSARTLAVGDVNGDNNPDIYVVCGRTGTQNAQDYLLTGNATGDPLHPHDDPGNNRRRWRQGVPDRLHPRRAHARSWYLTARFPIPVRSNCSRRSPRPRSVVPHTLCHTDTRTWNST